MSEFRVEKRRAGATLVLSTGECVEGHFFLADVTPAHSGPERVGDLLNAPGGFFPFEVADGGGSAHVSIFNRIHVVLVRLYEVEIEAQFDASYSVAPRKTVAMTMTNSEKLSGELRVVLRAGSDRLSDYASLDEPFRYVEAQDRMAIVNFAHVIEITPIAE